jgi:hypothetical protein
MTIKEMFDKIYEIRKRFGDDIEVNVYSENGLEEPIFVYNPFQNKILAVSITNPNEEVL